MICYLVCDHTWYEAGDIETQESILKMTRG